MRLLINTGHHKVLWALFLVSLAIRGWGLSEQPPLDDEVAAAFSATNYMSYGAWSSVMWEHPPLRNVVIFLSGNLFGGFSAWGLRSGSVLFGSLTVPLLGHLAHGLFRNAWAAFLAAFFLCVDPLHIALSRQAFQETTTAFFIVAGVLAAFHGIKKDKLLLHYLAGVCFGLASSSKWHGLFPWAATALVCFAAPRPGGRPADRAVSARLLTILTAYVAVPLCVYVAVFIPWLFRGHSLSEFAGFQLWLLKSNYVHRSSDFLETMLEKRAYLWFLFPSVWADFVYYQGKPYLGVTMGNFLTWILTLPALYQAGRHWMREHRFETGFPVLLFLISYLPLVFTTRGIWIFNSLAVIPFAFLLSARAASLLISRGRVSRKALSFYLGTVVLFSLLMYPLATMRALEYSYAKPLVEVYNPHR